MNAIGVIPARYASTRFPAKVLALIDGKPMIEHVWRRAKQCKLLDDVLIACDHDLVYQAAIGFGAKAVMTDPNLPSGSDRIAAAVNNLPYDLVVNIQGDEPFVDPNAIDDLVKVLKDNPQTSMGTAIKEINNEADFHNPNIVKCVIDHQGHALYFSRSPIPYNRNAVLPAGVKHYKHFGLYIYRKEFLLQYKDWPKSMLEISEQLEQLRVLERGYKIKTVITDMESIAVDVPDDLEKAKQWLKQLN